MFGIVLLAVLVVSLAMQVAVSDPSVVGLVWAGLAGATALGLIWPVVSVRILGVRVVASPEDLIVGQLGSVEIELSGRASGLTLRCTGSPLLVIDVVSPGVTRLPLEISARGAYDSLMIEVASDAPFGVLLATRSRIVKLPRRLLVGPVSTPTAAPIADLAGDQSEIASRGVSMSGESVRSVRPYVSGDPSHLVHWPTTARLGSLVVRELEPPVAQGIAIVVDLSPLGVEGPEPHIADLVEATASRAAGAAEMALASGARVMMCTVEATGPVVDEVIDLLGVRRRLALAIGGTPPAAPDDWPVMFVGVRGAS
ncbi:MAG TPA: DUF58 domain-containing protein [Microthrixaceae bacterium]|nr:DUF58 domain-containing protein [Microthrixaceae bacterium]